MDLDLKHIIPIADCTDVFNNYLKNPKYNYVNVYIDLKNVCNGLYVPDIVTKILQNNNKLKNNIDSSIFQSLLLTCSEYIKLIKSFNKIPRIYICNDVGRSAYHKNINENYKISREIGNTSLTEFEEPIISLRNKNFEIAEKIFNQLPNICFINLKCLESDFLPYYIITRFFKEEKNIFHIICSSDKDHFQVLNISTDIVMYNKKNNIKTITDKNNYLQHYIKFNKMSEENKLNKINDLKEIDKEYITLIMSIVGDKVDDVEGVNGFGPVNALKLFKNKLLLESAFGNINEFRNKILSNQPIELNNLSILNDEKWLKIVNNFDKIIKAFKQIDYECLVKCYEKNDTTTKQDILNYINNLILNKEKKNLTCNTFYNMLQSLNDFNLNKEILEIIF